MFRIIFFTSELFLAMAVASMSALAQDTVFELPSWAYPTIDEGRGGRGPDDGTLFSTPDSDLQFTKKQINDGFNPPDWYPNEHPPMPEIVAHGRQPDMFACARCHMPHGLGHPESSPLAGLPINYAIQQMRDYASGDRTSLLPGRVARMLAAASEMSEEDFRSAAEYYAQLKPTKWITVIEAAMVPETYVGAGAMRHAEPEGGLEPIGQRIIEIPEDSHRVELRDSHSGFIAYVPPGSVEAGKQLATTGAGRTIQCNICHGANLKGLGDVPSIAGRSPMYIARQLWDIKHGARKGTSSALMLETVVNLTDEDVLNLAAYLASLEP